MFVLVSWASISCRFCLIVIVVVVVFVVVVDVVVVIRCIQIIHRIRVLYSATQSHTSRVQHKYICTLIDNFLRSTSVKPTVKETALNTHIHVRHCIDGCSDECIHLFYRSFCFFHSLPTACSCGRSHANLIAPAACWSVCALLCFVVCLRSVRIVCVFVFALYWN